jgi:hypothetical protein
MIAYVWGHRFCFLLDFTRAFRTKQLSIDIP